MLLVVTYIIGCFLSALWLRGGGSRRLSLIVLGASALVCVIYLVTPPSFLSGFSISSLLTGETHDTARRAPSVPHTAVGRAGGVSWLDRFDNVSVAAGFARVQQLEERVIAARLGIALYLLGAAAIVLRPRLGLYLIVFFSLIGDAVLLPWYPFVKGFSSRESLFFVHDALIVGPLELYVVLIAATWFVREAWQRGWVFRTGPLFWPLMAFLAFVVFGLAHGVATGGDLRIALWEVRPVSYLISVMLLTSNLLETPEHASNMVWVAVLAVFLKGVIGSLYYLLILQGDLSGIESIAEHGAAIHLNLLFVSSLAAWMYNASWMKKVLLPLAIPFVVLGYIAMQRRAAIVTLAVAVVLAVALLYKENRRLFWIGAPALMLLGAGYVAMFWNSQSPMAAPAQAIKSVIAAQLASARDQSSNNYRVLENRNINFTIHRHPVSGIGFGQKFLIVVPMPDISQLFEWWEYVTHNSMMWIWMKGGIGAFYALLCLIGLAVVGGIRATEHLRSADLRAVTMAATLYIVMHFIYACVDMSWDAKSTVLVGAMMGVVNSSEWIEAGL